MRRLTLIALCCSSTACIEAVMVSRNMPAPARAPDCKLELVQADMMELSPMGKTWDYLGTVSIGANHSFDALSDEARAMIRPKACELGGTAVALMQNSNASAGMGTSSSIIYAVLRPKQAPEAPSQF